VKEGNGAWAHVTYQGISGYASMSYLKKISLAKPKLKKKSLSLLPGETFRMEVKNWEGPIRWESSDKTVAKVSKKGLVRALSPGDCTIFANLSDKTRLKMSLHVELPEISRKKLVLTEGKSKKLTVQGTLDREVIWSSSRPEVASVTKSGKVRAVMAGTAVIMARVGENELSCSVTVKKADQYVPGEEP
jgi:hypothetical protein